MGNYLDLKEKVWDTGLCTGCGGCVAVCPADALYFDNDSGEFNPLSTGYCKEVSDGVSCGACYAGPKPGRGSGFLPQKRVLLWRNARAAGLCRPSSSTDLSRACLMPW
jgi:ferredoxin